MLEEPLNLGPAASFMSTGGMSPAYGYYPSYPGMRAEPSLVTVVRHTKYEITTNAANAITVAKQVTLESPLRIRQEPQIMASGDGWFEVEPATGRLLSARFEANGAVTSESVTRRTTTSLQVRLLRGAEREAALRPPAPSATGSAREKPLSEAEVRELFGELQSDDSSVRTRAANRLMLASLKTVPPDLLEFLAAKCSDPDPMLQRAAVKVVTKHGTRERVPALLRLLKSDDYGDRRAAMSALGRLREPAAAAPIADLLATGDASSATEALIEIGPEAEDAVLALLEERHSETRRNACRVLKLIGTTKSLESLQSLLLSPQRSVSEAAGEAARAIIARQDP